jgi:hypothetical protein
MATSWFNRLLKRKSRPAPRASRRPERRPLVLEQLEDRCVPTVAFTPVLGTPTEIAGNVPGATIRGNHQQSLTRPPVVLIFAGTYWTGTQGHADELKITNSIGTLLTSNYFDALSQYGSGGGPTANGGGQLQDNSNVTLDDTSTQPSFIPLPGTLSTFIQGALNRHGVIFGPADSNTLWVVINDPKHSISAGGGVNYDPRFLPNITGIQHALYVNAASNSDGTLNLDQTTRIASHELAEATVPEVHLKDPGHLNEGFQISDNEPEAGTALAQYTYRLKGVLVQAYWSQQDGHFVVPDGNSQVITLTSGTTVLLSGGGPVAAGSTIPNGKYELDVGTAQAPVDGVVKLSTGSSAVPSDGLLQVIDVNHQVFAFPSSEINGSGQGQIPLFFVNTGDLNDTVNVDGIVAPLTVNLGRGVDGVFITPTSQDMANLSQPVTVNGGGGFDALHIDDQLELLPVIYTLTSSSVSRFDPNNDTTPTINFKGITLTFVNGGLAGNTFNLQPGASNYTLNGQGTDTLTGVANAVLTSPTSAGFSGFANNSIGFNGIDALDGTGTLTGENAASTWSVNAVNNDSSYSDGSHNLIFSGFLTLNGGTGGNTFNLQSGPGVGGSILNGSTGTDTLNGVADPILDVPSSLGFSGLADHGFRFSGIDVLKGTGALVGESVASTWTIDPVAGNNTYSDGSHSLSFSGFGFLDGQGSSNQLIVNDQGAAPNAQRTVTITPTGFTRTQPNSAPTSFSLFDFQTEVFNVSGTTTVQGTARGTSTTINVFNRTGFGALQVSLGSAANSLDSIQGAVNLSGQGGTDILVVNDQAGPPNTNRAVTISPTGFTRTFPGLSTTSVNVTGFQTETFNVSGSTTVQGTPNGTSTTINVFGGGLPVNLGPINPATGEGTLQPIQGPVNIESASSSPSNFPDVTINDEGDTSARTVFITPTQISGLTAPGAPINFPNSSLLILDISGPFVGGSTFNIDGTPAIEQLQVLAPGTGDTVNVHAIPAAGAPGFPFSTFVAGQTVNVGQNHSLQAIQGTVEVANAVFKQFFPTQGIPLANVNVDDSADTQSQTVTIGAGGITGPSGPISITPGSAVSLTYQGGVSSTGHNAYTITGSPDTSTLTLSAPGAGDVVNVQGTALGTTTTINGGTSGAHTYTIGSTSNVLDPILGVVTVNGSATDVLNVNDQGSTTPHIYNLTQGSPLSTFTRSAPGTPNVVINFSGIATQNQHFNDGPKLGTPTQAAELAFPTTVAAGRSATLSGRLVGTGELSLSVDWGDGTPVAHSTPDLRPFDVKHKYERPGTYHVRAVWTDSRGQSGFRELTIVVTAAGEHED